jgi:hypothetical protein
MQNVQLAMKVSAFYLMVTPYVSELLSKIMADFNIVGHLLIICQMLKKKWEEREENVYCFINVKDHDSDRREIL